MQKFFESLGLNEKEIRTFLKLLELGAQPISVIAKHTGIPRTTMYLVVDELKKFQLIDEFESSGVLFVKAIAPKDIFDVLKARKFKISQLEQELEDQLPQLEALENKLSITPQVRFFEGKEAVTKMYESLLKHGEFVAIFNPEIVKKMMPYYYNKVGQTVKKQKIFARELVVNCKEAQEYKKLFHCQNHQIKILKKGVTFKSDTLITKDRIYMISYGEKTLSGTEIYNQSLAETQYILFEQLWEAS